jgi:hypothetical protein
MDSHQPLSQLALERRAKVVSDFQQNLAPETIPTAMVADETAEGAIKLAIVTMTLVISEIRKDINTTTFLSTMLNTWTGVWKWIEFLHTRCIVGKKFGESLALQSLRIIPLIVVTFCETGLRKVIARTPEIFHILVPHWLREDIDETLVQLDHNFNFSAALRGILLLEEHHDANFLATIVNAADGGAEAVADAAIGRLRNVMVKDPPEPTQIVQHIWLVSAFATSLCPPLRSAMLHRRLLPTLVDVMNVIGAQPTHTPFHPRSVVMGYRTLSEAL